MRRTLASKQCFSISFETEYTAVSTPFKFLNYQTQALDRERDRETERERQRETERDRERDRERESIKTSINQFSDGDIDAPQQTIPYLSGYRS